MKIVLFSGPRSSFEVVKKRLTEYKLVYTDPTPESLLPKLKDANVYIDASMKVRISNEDINEAKNLELIVTGTTGSNHIEKDKLHEREIPLLTLKGQYKILNELNAAAEHSWALTMACARQLKGASKHVDNGLWNRTDFPGLMMKDKTIGLIGFGRIGSWMGRYANAFGMRVLTYDPNVTSCPEYVEQVSMEYLISESDIISLHIHLDESTDGIISSKIIEKFKEDVIFINTSRGELVDEKALLKALKSGKIAFAGLDVVCNEPDIQDNILWEYSKKNDNLIITPHIGGFCPDAVDKVVDFCCDRIIGFFGEV